MEYAKSIYDAVFGHIDFTKDGKCSGCGNCCSDLLPMTDQEIEVIRKYIADNDIKEQKHFPVVARNYMDMTCPFRDEKNKLCTIYEVRPTICKAFLCSYREVDIAKSGYLLKNIYHNVFVRKLFFNSNEDKAFIENFLLIKELENVQK